jgi:hypothetical protein
VARRTTNAQRPAGRRSGRQTNAPTASQPPDPPSTSSPAQNFAKSVDAVLAGANPVPWHHVNRLQLAQLLGVHPDSVTDYTRGGMPVITRGGHGKESTYDAIACLAWWRAQQGQNAKEAAQARAANASAELNELKLKEKAGELWPKAEIAVAGQAVIKQVSTTLRALPRRMTQAGLIDRAKEAAVTKLCGDTLRALTAWRPTHEQGTH